MPIKHHHQADTELQLTDEERQELAEAENAINRGIKAFWELCLALQQKAIALRIMATKENLPAVGSGCHREEDGFMD